MYQVGKDVRSATQRDWLFAILYAVRDRVMDSWREALDAAQDRELKRVYYLSMEFLTGRMLTNALMAVGIYDDTKAACAQLGADFDALLDLEADPGLGNGGLGRLAPRWTPSPRSACQAWAMASAMTTACSRNAS